MVDLKRSGDIFGFCFLCSIHEDADIQLELRISARKSLGCEELKFQKKKKRKRNGQENDADDSKETADDSALINKVHVIC